MPQIFLGATADTNQPISLATKLANRHGLIAGATGTGKTVTLQTLAEGFSSNGVPVFLADVKGDLSGLCQSGATAPALQARAKQINLADYTPQSFPVAFWDLYGLTGHPLRASIGSIDHVLLARMLELNDTQEGALNVACRVARDENLPLVDLPDLRSLLTYVGENAKTLTRQYGNVAPATLGAIQRQLLTLENQGAAEFFGEPAFNVTDLLATAPDGRGLVHIFQAQKVMNQSPRLYATFLLWLLTSLYTTLPEVGDLDKPKLVFFFDEAHLLFTDAPKSLLEKVTQVVRLIRSKGVGIFFVTQSPTDIPDVVLGQLGNIVQHALRAHTPKGQADIKLAAKNFRPNPAFKVEEVVTQLGIGEALVSVLEDKGTPGITQRTLIAPPRSLLGPCSADALQNAIRRSLFSRIYGTAQNRESAAEILSTRRQQQDAAAAQAQPRTRPSNRQSTGEAFAKSVVRGVGSRIATALVRGLLNALKK